MLPSALYSFPPRWGRVAVLILKNFHLVSFLCAPGYVMPGIRHVYTLHPLLQFLKWRQVRPPVGLSYLTRCFYIKTFRLHIGMRIRPHSFVTLDLTNIIRYSCPKTLYGKKVNHFFGYCTFCFPGTYKRCTILIDIMYTSHFTEFYQSLISVNVTSKC